MAVGILYAQPERNAGNMDLSELSGLLAEHQWLAALALVITALVRLMKSDTPLPWTVPARWRSWLALGLGVVGGILDVLVAGTSPTRAVLQGLTAGAVAIAAHDSVIEGLRGGRELFGRDPKDVVDHPRG
jgi:hypothetical protein